MYHSFLGKSRYALKKRAIAQPCLLALILYSCALLALVLILVALLPLLLYFVVYFLLHYIRVALLALVLYPHGFICS
jgi:hypothetical protein